MDLHLRAMVMLLHEADLIDSDKLYQVKAVMAGYWQDKIALVWSVEDIYAVAEQRGLHISQETAERVLELAYDKQDASIGVNWTVLDDHLDTVLREIAQEEEI